MAQAPDEDERLRSDALQSAGSILSLRQREEEERARLAAIVDSSDDAIVSKTLEGIIRTWNPGAQRIFGYTAAEVIGKPITLLIPPDRLSEETAILQQLRRGERIEHYETIRVHKDGTPLDVSLTVSPIRDRSGTIIGASKIARDITGRRRMEAALRESEARLRAVVEATPECVKIVAPDGALEFINPAGLGMIDANTLESVRGKCTFDLVAPEDRSQWIEHHRRVCAGESMTWEFQIVGLKGTRRWMETHAVPLGLAEGAVGHLSVTRDVTTRKQADAEREALLVAERAARAEAERIGLMKDQFLATLSHELRTPLNAILGWAQILASRARGDDELAEGLAVIERNTQLQARLIEDLLDMSRIVSGKIRLDVQQVDLQDVIKAAVASVRHSADARQIRMQVVLDPLAGPVWGDPARLQQCFWNLLSNAIKFTPRGGRVEVALHRVDSHLEICVTDTGAGINSDFLPHVFERFRQADASTTRRHGGLGLGLSIVKHLIELHGGRIAAHSAGEGQGATFCINLPVMVVHSTVAADRVHPRTPAAPAIGHPSLDGITVLAVDDESDARDLIRRVLAECGATVLLASSAAEALDLVNRCRPDMILSDIGMPGEDGYAFIAKVRALPTDKGGRTPAAALTAFARAEDRTRAPRAGYQTHVAKPVDPTELTAVVASLATRR